MFLIYVSLFKVEMKEIVQFFIVENYYVYIIFKSLDFKIMEFIPKTYMREI